LEQRLHLFLELDVQAWFLKHPFLLHWTNRTYSFIHIPDKDHKEEGSLEASKGR